MKSKLVCAVSVLTITVAEANTKPTGTSGEEANWTALSTSAAAPLPADDNDFRVYWKDGLRFETANKAFKLQIGGRIQYDWGFFSGDGIEDAGIPLDDGTEFRRARLFVGGTVYDNIEFKAQYEFAGKEEQKDTVDTSSGGEETVEFKDTRPGFKDVYLGILDTPVGNLRLGHFKEPFSLQELTSSKYITLMERSSVVEAFAPSRNSGAMLSDTFNDERGTWAVGLFRDTDDAAFERGDSDWAGTGRITYLPIDDKESSTLVHVGLAYSYRGADDDKVRYRARPEAHLVDRFVDTGTIAADSSSLAGVEAAWVKGPFSIQGEYMNADVDADGISNPDFDGFYVQTSYFLTGESRPYKNSEGSFSRVKPKANFGSGGGPGAWEVALRYSSIDLEDGDVGGDIEQSRLDNIGAGLNWYLNPNTRFMLNYIHADQDVIGSNAELLMLRFQIDF